MEDGGIAEQGTHNQLLKRGGLYKTLWEQQEKNPAGLGAVITPH